MTDTAQDAPETTEQDSTEEVVTPDVTTDKGKDFESIAAQERKQRQRANREAQAAKKRAEELEAELQAIKEKDLSDKEKAEAKAKKLELELANERVERAHLARVNTAIGKGIQSEYTDYIASELKKAEEADGADFNAEEWFSALKENKPAFFGGNGTPPPASGQGGPAVGKPGKAGELEAIKKEIASLLPYRHHQGNELKIMNLSAKAERLAKELSS